MRIGSDFDKIKWNFNGYEFLEPNAFFGDVFIFLLAVFLAFKILKINSQSSFSRNWIRFYFVFGVGFIFGAFGHLLFNYTGILGKVPAWYAGIIAVFFIEQAMVSIHPDARRKAKFRKISIYKFILVLILETVICLCVDLNTDVARGLALPTLNSVIGMGLSLGYLGYLYEKKVHPSFRYLWLSTFILIPSAFFQAFKINIHPWFDKNDFSHVLLCVSIMMYYMTIKRYLKSSNSPKFERNQ